MFALALDDATAGRSAVEIARELLPTWVVWGGAVVLPVVAFVCAWIVCGLGYWLTRRSRPLPVSAHWTERARFAEVHVLGALNARVWCCVLAGAGAWVASGQLSAAASRLAIGGSVAAASFAGGLVARHAARRAGRQPGGFVEYLVWRAPWWSLVALFCALPVHVDGGRFWLACGAIAATVWCFASGGPAVARGLGFARPIAESAARLPEGLRREQVLVYESRAASVCAFPSANSLFVAHRLLEILTPAEVTAVLRHEQAHLHENARTRARRVAAASSFVVLVSSRFLIQSAGNAGIAIVVAAGAWLVYAAVTLRQRAASSTAAAVASGDGEVYAHALEKLYADRLIPAEPSRKSSHPLLFDRMVAAGVTPEWPRPAPPPSGPFSARLVAAGATVTLMASLSLIDAFEPTGRRSIELALMIGGSTHARLIALAEVELDEHAPDRALAFARAAVELEPYSPGAHALVTTALIAKGRNDDARVEWETFLRVYHDQSIDSRTEPRWKRAHRSLTDGALAPRGAEPITAR
jgi:hypothetical protein